MSEIRDENRPISNNETPLLILTLKIIIVIAFVYPLLYYAVLNQAGEDLSGSNETIDDGQIEIIPFVEDKQEKLVEIEPQPTCPISYLLVILNELCQNLLVAQSQCTPEDVANLDKHKIPIPKITIAKNNTSGEPRGTIVGCVAAGLLLTSLGAAFIELYKAKSQSHQQTLKTKPPMSRKCSLADLTVLKHNRKELVRRESIMELPENGSPLKQLGFRPPPLYRRCSFPVGPSEFNQGNTYFNYTQDFRRSSIESRRLSIISTDSRKNSIDGRRISFNFDNESPDRRHWSRLVHRH